MIDFFSFFNETAYPRLAHRADSFRFIFDYLTKLNREVFIVETGCVRNEGTWDGEGQSTILFDKFAQQVPGTLVYSVDINPTNTALCRQLVSERVKVATSDSVTFLRDLANNPPKGFAHIDLLYLDSFDVDFKNPHPSAMHHLKELTAVARLVSKDTLIVIDDAPTSATCFVDKGVVKTLTNFTVGGKGMYVADYAANIGAVQCISGYQAGWTGF
jgi:hypothetical protein